MQDSVFTRIVKGEIPSHKLYEDELSLAFLDIHPAVEGQAVVVSKKQVEFVWDLPDEDYQAIMAATKKLAGRLKEVLGSAYVGVKIEGVDVPHAHVKLYPFNTIAEYTAPQDMNTEPNHEALAKLAERIKF